MELSDLISNRVEKFRDLPGIGRYYSIGDNSNEIISAINDLSYYFGKEMVFYGGTLCYPEILGFEKNLRKPSTDLDAALTPKGVSMLPNSAFLNKCFYIEEFNSGFMFYNDFVPVGLSFKKIHDWAIPADFFESAVNVKNSYVENSFFCSPEYLIALKLRREHSRAKSGKKLMGKDYMDIVSLLSSKNEVNIEKCKELVFEHVSNDLDDLEKIIPKVKDYIHQTKTDDSQCLDFLAMFGF